MASIRQCASDIFDTAQDGIGWIALWKDGRSWNTTIIFPEEANYQTETIKVDTYYENELREILAIDTRAILVNGYYHNLGVSEIDGTRDDLAAALRWQYEECSSHLTDYTIIPTTTTEDNEMTAEPKSEIKQMLDTDDTATYFEKLKEAGHPTWGQLYAYLAWQDTTDNNASAFEVRELPRGNNLEANTPEFVKTLREAGVDRFIVTDKSTSLMRGLIALVAAGCIIEDPAAVTRKPPYWNEETRTGLEIRIA